jgi:hypothetical protein
MVIRFQSFRAVRVITRLNRDILNGKGTEAVLVQL